MQDTQDSSYLDLTRVLGNEKFFSPQIRGRRKVFIFKMRSKSEGRRGSCEEEKSMYGWSTFWSSRLSSSWKRFQSIFKRVTYVKKKLFKIEPWTTWLDFRNVNYAPRGAWTLKTDAVDQKPVLGAYRYPTWSDFRLFDDGKTRSGWWMIAFCPALAFSCISGCWSGCTQSLQKS